METTMVTTMEPESFIVKSIGDCMYTDGNSWAYNPEELTPMSYVEAQRVRRQLYRKSRISDEFEVVPYDVAVVEYRESALDWKTDDE